MAYEQECFFPDSVKQRDFIPNGLTDKLNEELDMWLSDAYLDLKQLIEINEEEIYFDDEGRLHFYEDHYETFPDARCIVPKTYEDFKQNYVELEKGLKNEEGKDYEQWLSEKEIDILWSELEPIYKSIFNDKQIKIHYLKGCYNYINMIFYRLSPIQQKVVIYVYKNCIDDNGMIFDPDKIHRKICYVGKKRIYNKSIFGKYLRGIGYKLVRFINDKDGNIIANTVFKSLISKEKWLMIDGSYNWIMNTNFKPIEQNLIFYILAQYLGIDKNNSFNEESFSFIPGDLKGIFGVKTNQHFFDKSLEKALKKIYEECPTKLIKEYSIRKSDLYKGKEIWIKIR